MNWGRYSARRAFYDGHSPDVQRPLPVSVFADAVMRQSIDPGFMVSNTTKNNPGSSYCPFKTAQDDRGFGTALRLEQGDGKYA